MAPPVASPAPMTSATLSVAVIARPALGRPGAESGPSAGSDERSVGAISLLVVDDLVRRDEQCAVFGPQLRGLVEVPGVERLRLRLAQQVAIGCPAELGGVGMEIDRHRDRA